MESPHDGWQQAMSSNSVDDKRDRCSHAGVNGTVFPRTDLGYLLIKMHQATQLLKKTYVPTIKKM
jgi:hypothetical protein